MKRKRKVGWGNFFVSPQTTNALTLPSHEASPGNHGRVHVYPVTILMNSWILFPISPFLGGMVYLFLVEEPAILFIALHVFMKNDEKSQWIGSGLVMMDDKTRGS